MYPTILYSGLLDLRFLLFDVTESSNILVFQQDLSYHLGWYIIITFVSFLLSSLFSMPQLKKNGKWMRETAGERGNLRFYHIELRQLDENVRRRGWQWYQQLNCSLSFFPWHMIWNPHYRAVVEASSHYEPPCFHYSIHALTSRIKSLPVVAAIEPSFLSAFSCDNTGIEIRIWNA